MVSRRGGVVVGRRPSRGEVARVLDWKIIKSLTHVRVVNNYSKLTMLLLIFSELVS